jgi:transcriptional regulator with XRE-family HTH domain
MGGREGIVLADKDTKQLEHELSEADSVEEFFAENGAHLRQLTLAEYLGQLLEEKGLTKAEVVRRSNLDQVYGYHIFSGYKKSPSKEKALALALALGLSPEEAQRLLYYAGAKQLYVRDPWDSVIWYALEHKLSVGEANELLEKLNLGRLLG